MYSLPFDQAPDTGAASLAEANSLSPPARPAAAPLGSLPYTQFVGVLKDALRNFSRPDVLTRSPLLRSRLLEAGRNASPTDLQNLLTRTVNTLFADPRDEKLRRVIELSYFRPAEKQVAVAERLGLAFGTYRRYLTTACDRLARWLWDSGLAKSAGAPGLSIVVLPFANLGDEEQDHLVHGITENLTTDLSRLYDMSVIRPNISVAFGDKTNDPRQLGQGLGVRYVLEGSVQTGASHVRIGVQLVDATTGAHLWAERFDRPLADVLEMQDEITSHIVRSVDIELVAAESRRAAEEGRSEPDSALLTLQARAIWNRPYSHTRAREARSLFEAALRLDPNNIAALLGLADTHMRDVNFHGSNDRAEQIRLADAAVSRARALAPASAHAHFTHGTVLSAMRAPERARRQFEVALSIDRNLANAHAYIGLMEIYLGRAERVEAHVTRAIRLSPRDPHHGAWLVILGMAELYLGRLARALEHLQRAVAINPNCGCAQMGLAVALALAGRDLEAAECCMVARRLTPDFTISKYRSEAMSENPVYLAQRQRFCDGLRRLGVPE